MRDEYQGKSTEQIQTELRQMEGMSQLIEDTVKRSGAFKQTCGERQPFVAAIVVTVLDTETGLMGSRCLRVNIEATEGVVMIDSSTGFRKSQAAWEADIRRSIVSSLDSMIEANAN